MPNGAPGGAAACVTGRAHPESGDPRVTGTSPWVRLVDRKVCPAGLVSLLTEGGDPPWRLPALHPLVRGGRKQEYGLTRAPETKTPGGGALA